MIGDILISLQGKEARGMEQVISIYMQTKPDTPLTAVFLRWDTRSNTFSRLTVDVPSKPLGLQFLPI
jgi:hypothetical protein